MVKKTTLDKVDKSQVRGSSADKHVGDKTPIETPKTTDEPEIILPYTLTGNFEADFTELCIRAGFPSMKIAIRQQRPTIASPTENTTSSLRGEKNVIKEDIAKSEEGIQEDEEEPPPTTFLIRDKYSYFQPKVEIEMDDEAKSSVKDIYVRGWKIDDRILDIFLLTIPPLDKLTKIDFWNNGLTDDSINSLATAIQGLPNLKTLNLDNNPITLQRYGVFLGEESTIQNLSLRNCYVNDMGAKFIGNALTTNKSLISLNLCYNKLTCDGATNLFKVS